MGNSFVAYFQEVKDYLKDPGAFRNSNLPELEYLNVNRRQFTYDNYLSSGAAGTAYLFNEIDKDGNQIRQIVVKIAMLERDDDDTQTDLKFLRILRNVRHVVDLIDINQVPLRRPILIAEFLGNGTVST